jgi:hypothetical protein
MIAEENVCTEIEDKGIRYVLKSLPALEDTIRLFDRVSIVGLFEPRTRLLSYLVYHANHINTPFIKREISYIDKICNMGTLPSGSMGCFYSGELIT